MHSFEAHTLGSLDGSAARPPPVPPPGTNSWPWRMQARISGTQARVPWRDPPEGSTATAAAVAARHKGAAPATRKRTGSCCRIAGRPTRERARTHRAKLGHADVRATAWRYKLPCIRCQKASAWEKGLPWPELDRPATATTVPAGHKLLALPELHRGAPPGENKGGTGRESACSSTRKQKKERPAAANRHIESSPCLLFAVLGECSTVSCPLAGARA